jgi:leader peptidase (prepilin peptidase)/N-methyltransferase
MDATSILAFLFGLLIGSFLNVCIYRWPRDLSVVRPRSHCPQCEKLIAWYDNVPLLSYALLRGRCRRCRARISIRYPAVELLTGLLFFYFVREFGPSALAVKLCVFSAALLALAFSDLEERILPDEFTLGGILAGLAFALFIPTPDQTAQMFAWLLGGSLSGRTDSVVEAALGAALPSVTLWIGGWVFEKVRHKEGLGLGDVKLIAMMGAFLGLRGALMALFLGSLGGSILGYAWMKATGKDPASYQLPFGTFLAASGIAVSIFSRTMLG